MYYAIKSVDGIEKNLIVQTWAECSTIVLKHNAIYKSFSNEENAIDFLKNTQISNENIKDKNILPEAGTTAMYLAKIKNRIFQSEENGFSVMKFKIDSNSESLPDMEIMCNGYYLPNISGFRYAIYGTWKIKGKWGKQFEITSYKEMIEQDMDSVLNYLSSGAIKGIGMATAVKICEKFGSNTLAVLDKEPNRLLEIKGISKNKLNKIIASYEETRCAKEVIAYLQKYQISTNIGYQVYRKYGIDAINKIKKNPYDLCQFRGIRFEIADIIAKGENISPTDKRRLIACFRQLLKDNEIETGSLGMDLDLFGYEVLKKLNHKSVTKEYICSIVIDCVKKKFLSYRKINENEKYIFLPEIMDLEKRTAENIINLADCDIEAYTHLDALIYLKEGDYGIDLDETQKNAVKGALENNFCVITGGPGTGKTTIVKMIASIWEDTHPDQQSVFMAPTGRAARRIKESTGYNAETIHKHLGIRDSEEESESNLIPERLVIVDEVSMMDSYIADKLFSSIEVGTKVILIGDIDQLQSVGAGSVLREIIDSGIINVFRLDTVHRQKDGNSICANAVKIKNGHSDFYEDSNFRFIKCNNATEIQDMMFKNYIHDVYKYGIENVCCLCPIREKTAGVREMNAILQETLNPKNNQKSEVEKNGMIFRVGDLVMQLKNNEDVSNGDVGIIHSITDTSDNKKCIRVEFFHSITIDYNFETLAELTLAYAMTVHKSQGSEYTSVHTCIHSNYTSLLRNRNMLYTAITRGKRKVTLYYDTEKTVQEAVSNVDNRKRISLLSFFLRFYQGKIFVPVA